MIQNQTETSRRHGAPIDPAEDVGTTQARALERVGSVPESVHRPDLPRSPLALWCAQHRWVVLGTSLLLVLGSIGLLAAVGITTTGANDQLVGDSAEAYDILDGADFGDVPTEFVIVTDPEGPIAPDRAAELGSELVTTYETVPGVIDVGDVFPGQDGSIVLPLEFATDEEGVALEIDGSLRATDELAAAHSDLTISQFGQTSLDQEMNATVGEDFQRAELFAIPATLIILLLAFGAVVAAGVPLVIGLGSVAAALGLTALVSTWLPVDQNSQAIVLLIGLAVGVDYALLILRRAREERRAGASVLDSIGIAGATAGRAVLISGLTVVIAMSGMLVAGGMFTSLGLGAMLVVGVAVIAAVTVLPALMGLLGDKIDALRLPFTRRREARRGSEETFWGHLAGIVTRHPLAALLVVGGLLVALAAPALGMKTAIGNVEALPQDLKSVQAYHQFNAAAPAQSDSLQVVVRAPADSADEVEAALLGTTPDAEGIEHVSGAAGEVVRSTDSTVTTWDLGLDVTPSDDEMTTTVEQVRDELLPQVRAELADVPGADVHLGGQAAVADLTTWMDERLPWVVGFVLVLSLLVMLVSFGSPALAAATVGLNLLSVGAAYGALVVVFGGTWAEGLLDFTSTGAIASWLPMMLFVLLFGLSMDYHIFVTSRVREAFDAGASPRRAVRQGVARSAGVVTAAAAVMVGVFSIFGTLSMLEMKQLGVGLAVAVLIDATIVRGVLLPAVLTLLGERAHTGPSWLPRLHH
ncbi:MMPL family transporter [Ornithinimicrobium ciconiae]|uniref:MMPL family transporter n=1 Tax=Ornithinimicrobium ciconiae TaxID=2594265 RepID=A0A516G7U8_9MICO|nr:MMPL family transporter [Ornithinimicrobium ciconiae]QDO87575.1 MMPL family transporter [Ornithinimicrobium ciconiae]